MAAATLDPPADIFEDSIERIRESVITKFAELVEQVLAREALILTELDAISGLRRQQRDECEGRKRELEEMRNQNKSNLNYPELRTLQQEFMKKIEDTIKDLEHELINSFIHFDWHVNISNELSKLGKVQLLNTYTLAPKIYYKHKVGSVLRRNSFGQMDGELTDPRVICIEPKTGDLLISEKGNNRVQRFDRNGNYLSIVGGVGGGARMRTPDGIAINEDKMYISQYGGHNVQVYLLSTGEFDGNIGHKGYGPGELEKPTGLAINKRNNDLYVCDRGNSRIQIFNQDTVFKCMFGSENLNRPIDIKLTGYEIFVLDESNPCIHVYNYENQCLRSLISNGNGKQTADPYCFCFDFDSNIYVTDFKRNCVSIFNPSGDLLHQIGNQFSDTLCSPTGIAIDLLGRVVVVDKSLQGCVRFF